jgi:hypothetical protein
MIAPLHCASTCYRTCSYTACLLALALCTAAATVFSDETLPDDALAVAPVLLILTLLSLLLHAC